MSTCRDQKAALLANGGDGEADRERNAAANAWLMVNSHCSRVEVHGLDCRGFPWLSARSGLCQDQQELHVSTTTSQEAVLIGIKENLSFAPVRVSWPKRLPTLEEDNSVGENCKSFSFRPSLNAQYG